MSSAVDLATVLRLACLTEDRTDREQRALLRVADRLDHKANRQTVTNRRDSTEPSRLYELVQDSRDGLPLDLPNRRGTPRKATA